MLSNNSSDAEIWEFSKNWFWIVRNERLESKGWFRFTRVLQALAIICVIGVTALIFYVVSSQQTLFDATIQCKDGTTWNAIEEASSYGDYKSELSMYDKCGLCTQRSADGMYQQCDVGTNSNKLFDSYTTDRKYNKDHSIFAVIVYASLTFFGGLFIVNIVARTLIYVLGGSKKEN